MTEREEVIERLRQAEIGGGSHESLSAIAKAIMPDVIYGWTRGACERLRDKLLELIGFGGTATVDGLSELPELLRKAAEGGYEGERGKVIDNVAQLIGCETTTHSSVIKALADKVERELRRQYNHRYDAVFASADDWLADHEDELSELGWVDLSWVIGRATILAGGRWYVVRPDSWEDILYDARYAAMGPALSDHDRAMDELVARCKALAGGDA